MIAPAAGNALPRGWDAAGFRRALGGWFARHGRPLPWREGYDPYQVWVSEIMLQQTQVDAMLPCFARWMARFPTLAAVAAADEAAVLKAWEGLGYYSRARNLHRAAREMAARHGGRVPGDPDDLLALPGIGRYTAGAVASIAFDRPVPVVDGNIARVLARLFMLPRPVREPGSQRRLWAWAGELVRDPSGATRPRMLNQGLMELGALVCKPRAPRCGDCPVRGFCAAERAGRSGEFPHPAPRRERPLRHGVMLLARDDAARLLLRRRPSRGLWGGLWEPPWLEREPGEDPPAALKRLLAELGLPAEDPPEPAGCFSHGLTHFQLEMTCFARHLAPAGGRTVAPGPPEPLRWVDGEALESLPLARFAHKALALDPA